MGEGTFLEPAALAIQQQGARLAQESEYPYVDPFADVKPVESNQLVLVFAGNPSLTTRSSKIPSRGSGRLLKADAIRRGGYGLFSQFAPFKETFWLTIPCLVVFHISTVALLSKVFIEALWRYFLRCYPNHDDLSLLGRVLRASPKALSGFLLCGFALFALNLSTPGIYDDYNGCSDDFLRSTISYNKINQTYQWLWATFSCVVLILVAHLTHNLVYSARVHRAYAVYRCLFLFTAQASPTQMAISMWRDGMPARRVSAVRRGLFWLLHIPVLALASLPAMAFVSASTTWHYCSAELLLLR